MEHSRSHCSRSRVGNLSFVRLHLLVFLLFFAPTCAGARTCDYRVVEEATYSAFNLTALGLNGSTSIAMNGDFSGAHGRAQSIQSFVAQSEAYVRNLAVTGIAPKVHDGVNTTDMITLDIELPVDWKLMARGCAGCWNDTLASAVADALAMRIKVAHDVFPHATIALYGITHNTKVGSASLGGYERAASLGAFDALDFMVPVLYLGPGMNASAHTHDALTSASTLRTRDGRAIPMAPFLSWIYFGNGEEARCAVPTSATLAIIAVIEALNGELEPQPLPIPIVSFWFGSDVDTVNHTHGCADVEPLEWLSEGIVPMSCLPSSAA